MTEIILLVGVPGSGKTYIASQLTHKFEYVPHDNYPVNAYSNAIKSFIGRSHKKVIAEVPFRASVLMAELITHGITCYTCYVDESLETCRSRYEERDNKAFPKMHITNLHKYQQRDWDKCGTSSELLEFLRNL